MKRGSCDAITGAAAVAEYNSHNHSHSSAGTPALEHAHHDYQTNKKSTFNTTANAKKSKRDECEEVFDKEGLETDKEIKGDSREEKS